MRMTVLRSHLAITSALASLLLHCSPATSQPPPSYVPDLSIRITCDRSHDADFEALADGFIRSVDFDVLNISRVRREHPKSNEKIKTMPAEVVGLRSDGNAIVHLLGHGDIQGEY